MHASTLFYCCYLHRRGFIRNYEHCCWKNLKEHQHAAGVGDVLPPGWHYNHVADTAVGALVEEVSALAGDGNRLPLREL
jgi:hypothetical protein